MNEDRPSSSVEERHVPNVEAAASKPASGYIYAVLRKEMTSGALLSQAIHAATECLTKDDVPLPGDTVARVLGATKEQLAGVAALLSKDGIRHQCVLETDGPLAGVITAIGLYTRTPDSLKPILGELKRWKEPK